MLICFMCNEKFENINHLFIHLKNICEFYCKQPGCLRVFSNKDSYKRHLKCHDFDSDLSKVGRTIFILKYK